MWPTRPAVHIFQPRMQITHDQLDELIGVTEDTVEYFCDQNQLSGELAWTCIEALAEAKLAELAGRCVAD